MPKKMSKSKRKPKKLLSEVGKWLKKRTSQRDGV